MKRFPKLTRTNIRAAWRRYRRPLAYGALGLFTAFVLYWVYLDHTVRAQFEGKRWALPARVYAQPLEMIRDTKLSADQLIEELGHLNYQASDDAATPGSYRRQEHEVELHTRPFAFWNGAQPPMRIRAVFHGGRVAGLYDMNGETTLNIARLDPLLIGSIYPAHNEDRVLVQLADVPKTLIDTLIAIEDRKFYKHNGVDPRGIARAVVNNIRNTGRNVQGGSTLTQQLVKNFYLTADRTLRRKFTELLMSLSLEFHYEKDEILEAYINEIYLGQDGSRGIHGFGLASQFYFNRALGDLDLAQTALLVGMVKGPSYYDPRRHPQRALARRNLVLSELLRQQLIAEADYEAAKAQPLTIVTQARTGASPYPAFLDLVHRQLRRDYREEDLRSEGLKIFTTLDPRTQRAAEHALSTRLQQLERDRGIPKKSLEGAVIVTNSDNGEVLGVVGGREVRFAGFNRALDADRPIGSLVKPVVFLTALQRAPDYSLVTPLDDNELKWRDRGGQEWVPMNYDKQYHGRVSLRAALIQSYNVSTARLGLLIGIPAVVENMRRLGVEREIPAYGSTLLGSTNLTPLEVTQMYQTLASGGFRTPLRAIREVLTVDNQPLQRYALSVEPVIDAAPLYLLTNAMQDVVREGTGAGLQHYVSPSINVAGKTGTTDDLRDGWFAGYTGDRLAVVWVGRDDNRPSGLTGASGALTVWGEMMARLPLEPLETPPPEEIERVWIDRDTLLRADSDCNDAIELPFIRGSAPVQTAPCVTRSPAKTIKNWFKRLFQR